jgi:hypothetical protein
MKNILRRVTQLFALTLIAYLSVACQHEITVDLAQAETQTVIEGAVSDAPGPYTVKVTRTNNLSEATTYPAVSGATVLISDDLGVTDTLREATPGIYQTQQLVGRPGHTYTLRVTVDGKTTTAISTMPPAVSLDTLLFRDFARPGGSSGFATLPVFQDPTTLGNNYRFLQKVNGEADGTYIVYNDNINNGQMNQRPIVNPATEIVAGDTVDVEMRCIDLSAYNYYFTLSQIAGGGPGGGATPSNPPTNLMGDQVVGIFTAYTTQRRVQIAR